MNNSGLTIKDLLKIDGQYENFIVSSNKLIAIVLVEALNLDLEDDFVLHSIIENYSAFILAVKNRNEKMMNISMTAKNDTEQYILYLKRKYIEVESRTDLDEQAKENIQQLIASKILDVEEHVRKNETVIKQHMIILAHELKGKDETDYEEAHGALTDKCSHFIAELHDCLRSCNRDVDIRVTNNKEALKILHHFTDNKIAMLSD